MANKIYNNKVASKRTLQTLNINSLLGVDYTSSMNNIADYHAYEMSNYLKINNSLQTRAGYEQIYHSEIQGNVNGLWKCNYKGKEIIIAHIGNGLYVINSQKGLNNYCFNAENYISIYTDDKLIKNQKSFAVFANDRLYILCGSYILVKFSNTDKGNWTYANNMFFKATRVFEDEDTYIPTTTINITDEEKTVLEINRETLDEPNMMTNWRYNTINTFCGYKLDDNGNQTPIYGSTFKLDNKISESYIIGGFEIEIITSGKTINGISNVENSGTENQYFNIVDSFGNEIGQIGSMSNNVWGNRNTIYLKESYVNPDNSNANITVKFKVDSNDYKLIDNCTFGVMYGAGGNRNRLFVSGNPEYPNVDYHTSRRNIYSTTNDADLLDNQDLTYFSAFDYCEYGTTNTAVTGYQIMGDGSLLVLKEKSETEPSVFFRDSTYQTDNNTSFVTEAYPLRVGNIGEGSVKGLKGSIKNLNNDIVFVSPNGLFGISATVSAGMLASDYKYAYSRSRIINNKFVNDIRESTHIATCLYDNKYFVTIKKQDNSYKTYVADGRYKYASQDKVDNEYDYEWFILDNIPAEEYLIVNENLYFTNDKGLYLFDFNSRNENKFNDIVCENISTNEFEITYEPSYVTSYMNEELANKLSKFNINKIKMSDATNASHYQYLGMVSCSGEQLNLYDMNDGNIDKLRFYLEHQKGLLLCGSDGTIKNIILSAEKDYDRTDDLEVYNLNLQFGDITGGIYYLFENIGNKEFNLVRTSNENGIQYQIEDEFGLRVHITNDINYKNIFNTVDIIGIAKSYIPITSKYITKAFNNGQSLYNKILHSLTVVNDSEEFSFVNLGLSTKTLAKRFDDYYRSGTSGLDDTYLNIFNADLTSKTFASSFTKNYLLKYNFIQFEFFNNEGMNSVINNLMITYTIGFKTIGVK